MQDFKFDCEEGDWQLDSPPQFPSRAARIDAPAGPTLSAAVLITQGAPLHFSPAFQGVDGWNNQEKTLYNNV